MSPDTTVLDRSIPLRRGPTSPEPDVVPADRGLRLRYEAYCRGQGMALASLLPREAVRPLYRAALEAGGGEVEGTDDPLEVLGTFCRELLPLPPYEVWREDFMRHRDAHLQDDPSWVRPEARDEPVAVELRSLDALGEHWYATLNLRRDEAGWRGHIAFHTVGAGRAYRTAEIFREDEGAAVRERFLELDDMTLTAFLRSVLP